jgi:hypothetical protein
MFRVRLMAVLLPETVAWNGARCAGCARTWLAPLAAVAVFVLLTVIPCRAAWFLDIEGGGAFAGYNDVQIPRDGGTRFSLTEDLSTDPAPFVRMRAGVRLGEKHHLSAFAAPLRLSAAGETARPIDFEGTRFPGGSALDATYRFDSYRLTYRYRAYASTPWQAWVGLTAKIRDAEIRLSGNGLSATKANTGFVPLLSFAVRWMWSERLCGILEGDALAGGPGRAEDVFAGVGFFAAPRVTIRGGYRILEGGADVEEVYNFALIHYVSLGIQVNL